MKATHCDKCKEPADWLWWVGHGDTEIWLCIICKHDWREIEEMTMEERLQDWLDET